MDPDFAIGDRLQTLVEIKPVMSVLEIDEKTLPKIENAVSDGTHVLLLGADPTTWRTVRSTAGRHQSDGQEMSIFISDGRTSTGCLVCARWMAVGQFAWTDMTHKSGRVDGGNNVPMDARTMLVTYWRKACNEVQWMGGKQMATDTING